MKETNTLKELAGGRLRVARGLSAFIEVNDVQLAPSGGVKIEWPPSPWRLLRALISVGYTSGAWNGAGPPPAARALIERLSADLPRYFVPCAVGAHSRHYMPVGVLNSKTKVEDKTLVFDTWARVDDRELVATWRNVFLDHAELAMLSLSARW